MYTFESHCFTQGRQSHDARGFGLIDIVVAMFLLVVVSVAVLPLLVQGLNLSSTNATLAAASQLANQQIELVRPLSLCSSIVPATTTVATQGVTLRVSRTIGSSCPITGYPITVPVSVSVTRTDTNAVVASARTLVFATGP